MIVNSMLIILFLHIVREVLRDRKLIDDSYIVLLQKLVGVAFSLATLFAENPIAAILIFVATQVALLKKSSFLMSCLKIITLIFALSVDLQFGVLAFVLLAGFSKRGRKHIGKSQIAVVLLLMSSFFESAVITSYMLPAIMILILFELVYDEAGYAKRFNSLITLIALTGVSKVSFSHLDYNILGLALVMIFILMNFKLEKSRRIYQLCGLSFVAFLGNKELVALYLVLVMVLETLEYILKLIERKYQNKLFNVEQLLSFGSTSVLTSFIVMLVLRSDNPSYSLFWVVVISAISILHESKLYQFKDRNTWISVLLSSIVTIIVFGLPGTNYLIWGLGKNLFNISEVKPAHYYIILSVILCLNVGINFLKSKYNKNLETKLYMYSHGIFKPVLKQMMNSLETLAVKNYNLKSSKEGSQRNEAFSILSEGMIYETLGAVVIIAIFLYLLIAVGTI